MRHYCLRNMDIEKSETQGTNKMIMSRRLGLIATIFPLGGGEFLIEDMEAIQLMMYIMFV